MTTRRNLNSTWGVKKGAGREGVSAWGKKAGHRAALRGRGGAETGQERGGG